MGLDSEKNSGVDHKSETKKFSFIDDSVLNSFSIVILSSKFDVCNVKLTQFKELNSVCISNFYYFFRRVYGVMTSE